MGNHNKQLIELVHHPEIIGLEKIVRCDIELPFFKNIKERLDPTLYLIKSESCGSYKIFTYNVMNNSAGKFKGCYLGLAGEVDLIFYDLFGMAFAIEYKANKIKHHSIEKQKKLKNRREKKVEKQLTRAKKFLPINYGIYLNHLFYVQGDDFELEELTESGIWVPK